MVLQCRGKTLQGMELWNISDVCSRKLDCNDRLLSENSD